MTMMALRVMIKLMSHTEATRLLQRLFQIVSDRCLPVCSTVDQYTPSGRGAVNVLNVVYVVDIL